MNKSNKNQKVKIVVKADSTFPVGQAANIIAAYRKLFAALNAVGYYPESPEEAKRIAEELLARGRKED
jgi:hypothetical protein